jgi:hypothetical protein
MRVHARPSFIVTTKLPSLVTLIRCFIGRSKPLGQLEEFGQAVFHKEIKIQRSPGTPSPRLEAPKMTPRAMGCSMAQHSGQWQQDKLESLWKPMMLFKNYEVVFTAWLRHRQQDVAEGLRTCEEVSENPDASNAVVIYQEWASACMSRWSEDIKILGDNFVNLASRVQEACHPSVPIERC